LLLSEKEDLPLKDMLPRIVFWKELGLFQERDALPEDLLLTTIPKGPLDAPGPVRPGGHLLQVFLEDHWLLPLQLRLAQPVRTSKREIGTAKEDISDGKLHNLPDGAMAERGY